MRLHDSDHFRVSQDFDFVAFFDYRVIKMTIEKAGHAFLVCEVSDAVMSPATGTRRNDLVLLDAGLSVVGLRFL